MSRLIIESALRSVESVHNILPEATANVKIIGQKDSEERKGTNTGL